MIHTKYFKEAEFACKCGCGFVDVEDELVQVLIELRETFMLPVTINSACRCIRHNKKVGGVSTSKHTKGMAADIVVKDINPDDVYFYLDKTYPDTYGIGNYNTFTHIDVREKKARW